MGDIAVTSPIPTRRRRPTFAIRTLLAMVAVSSLAMAWVAREQSVARSEANIAEVLRANGFHVTFAGAFDDPQKRSVDQPWWRGLLSMIAGPRAVAVANFNDEPLNDDLLLLSQLGSLQDVQLYDTQITDLACLESLTNLRSLQLSTARLKDITFVKRLNKLEWFGLYGNQDVDIAPIGQLTELRTVAFDGTTIEDIAPLATLKQLRELRLAGTRVSDLAPLADCKQLELLDLSDTAVKEVSHLKTLTNLQLLYLQRCDVDQERLDALQRSLPNCEITR